MNVIEEVRLEREELARVLKKHKGLRKIVEDLYPDRAHFIYELLQNAEDAGASEACFVLNEFCLVFEHKGGRSFDKRDIEGITDIGEGTKAGDDDKIGCFGVGFKSVFAYTETPHIWSPTFSFKITDLVLPWELEAKPNQQRQTTTRFEFPFNNPKKDAQTAFTEIESGLNELAETTLLFLSNLKVIRWQIDDAVHGEIGRIQHPKQHIELRKTVNGSHVASAHFLCFNGPVTGHSKLRVAIAYELGFVKDAESFTPKKALAKQLKIVPANPGQVAVYFPAEKETSRLRFHFHAPFVPTLDRASIKDTNANIPLFEDVARLTADSLHRIRDFGLLTAEFLDVLPNPVDGVREPFKTIQDAIVTEMNTQPLTPTFGKSHTPATHLLQGSATLKKLVPDIDALVSRDTGDAPIQWTISAQSRSRRDLFLSSLDIPTWDTQEFVQRLIESASDDGHKKPEGGFMEWLASKTSEWHQRLYALLMGYVRNYRTAHPLIDYQFQLLRIVKRTDGTYSRGSQSYFPTEGTEDDAEMPRVDRLVYSSGDGDESNEERRLSKEFLTFVGVREVDEGVLIERLLQDRYQNNSFKPQMSDMPRFIAYLKSKPERSELFGNYFIFKGADNKWHKPSDLFLDLPFAATDMSAWHGSGEHWPQRVALSKEYLTCGVELKRFVEFAIAVGVEQGLEISITTCYGNPEENYLIQQATGNWRDSGTNQDFVIHRLRERLVTPSQSLARLVWKTACEESGVGWLEAKYSRNQSQALRTKPSQLVCLLRDSAWIPQRDGRFVTPRQAESAQLPDGFPFDPGWQWLTAIGFGEETKNRVDEARERKVAAMELLGCDDLDALEDAKWLAGLSREERQRMRQEFEGRTLSIKKKPARPTATAPNPEIRKKRKEAEVRNAPKVEQTIREVKNRDNWEIKQAARTSLRRLNTNKDHLMVCQVCENEMPFKLDNGEYYFVAQPCVLGVQVELRDNYIALCPVCAAKFQNANGTKPQDLKQAILSATGLEISVTLARENCEIHFTAVHLQDLQTALKVVEQK